LFLFVVLLTAGLIGIMLGQNTRKLELSFWLILLAVFFVGTSYQKSEISAEINSLVVFLVLFQFIGATSAKVESRD
jgi:NADH:ubiquinone oxidoreductase subunit K